MHIFLNQQSKEIESYTVTQMLTELSIQSAGIAIAVNQQVIPRSQWDSYVLAENDRITIIRATQGG